MSLKLRIIAIVGVLILFSLTLSSFLSYSITSKNIRETIEAKAEKDLTAKLSLVREEIELYFNFISSQLQVMAEEDITATAVEQFSIAFQKIDEQSSVPEETIDASLLDFYQSEFAKEYENKTGQSIEVEPLLNQLTLTAKRLQYAFISNSPFPLKEKDGLFDLGDTSDYAKVHNQYHKKFRAFLQKFGFYDVFLVDTRGDVVYSVFKELDFATNIATGSYADTGLGEAYQQAMTLESGGVHLTPFKPYLPSYAAPATFIASPIFDGEQRLGVLIFQMPIDEINTIMTHEKQWKQKGFGDSGETYLVNQDKLLINESRFYIEDKAGYFEALSAVNAPYIDTIKRKGTTIGIQRVDSPGVETALAGKTGFARFNDYRNVPVLSAHEPIEIHGLRWAILAEIDVEEAYRSARELESSLITTGVLLTIFAVIATIIILIFVTEKLFGPFARLTQVFKKLNSTEADLSTELEESDVPEIRTIVDGFNQFISQIRNIVDSVRKCSEVIAAASTELSATTEQVSHTARTQESQAVSVTESLHQFNDALAEVSRISVSAASNTRTVRQSARDNKERSTSASSNIQQLVSEVTKSSKSLKELQSEIKNIDDILKVISGIAEQTNLLALNAAIEAARAGEHGRGFAVVADEVRNLASLTQQSTVQIQQQIEQLHNVANNSVSSMERASSSAAEGISLVKGVSDSFHHLSSKIDELESINETVASANEEQKYTCDGINDSIGVVSSSALELSQACTEIAAASESLSVVASDLQRQVEKFKMV